MASPKKTSSAKKSKRNPNSIADNSITNFQSLTSTTDDCDLSKAEKINVDKLITQAFLRHTANLVADKKEKFKEVSHLSSIVEEYLSCFSLIGYTFEGEKVCFFNAVNSKDEAALVDLLRSTFLEIVNNRP